MVYESFPAFQPVSLRQVDMQNKTTGSNPAKALICV
jgi:hypothetical protein